MTGTGPKKGAVFACALAAACVAASPAQAAEPDAGAVQAATRFFDKGVQRMDEGKCESSPVGKVESCREARQFLERAYELYPAGLGALRNLARVERSLGLYVDAAKHYRDLIRKAPLDPKPARQLWATFARKELEEVEPLIAHIVFHPTNEGLDGIRIALDREALPAQAIGMRLDVDPGEHTVHAEAPSFVPFDATVRVQDGETRTVVFTLQRRLAGIAQAPPVSASPRDQSPVSPAVSPPTRDNTRDKAASESSRLPAVLLVAGGGAGVLVGLALGYVALKKRESACGTSKLCEPEEFREGKAIANTSTLVTGVGVAVMALGGLWYFLAAPRSTRGSTTARVVPVAGPSFVGVGGSGTF